MLLAMAEHGHGWWFLWPIIWLAVTVGVVWFFMRRYRVRGEPPAQPGA